MIPPNPPKTDVHQRLFDKAIAHILQQERQCQNDMCQCSYRSKDMKEACAVGILIPDEMYELWWDENNVPAYDLPSTIMAFLGYPDVQFLRKLQVLHDSYHPTEKLMVVFLNKAKAVADQFGLHFDPLNPEGT